MPRYQLRFEQRGGSTAGYVGGRGEVFEKTTLVFSDGTRSVDVAPFDEYDRRPFYDAWEYRRVNEAVLFRRGHEDALWNVGGPVVTDRYYTSDDGGATWSEASQAAGQDAVKEATLLQQQARK